MAHDHHTSYFRAHAATEAGWHVGTCHTEPIQFLQDHECNALQFNMEYMSICLPVDQEATAATHCK
jgi:hypothetical protein